MWLFIKEEKKEGNVAGIEFRSDNNSNKLPYDIYQNGINTYCDIIFNNDEKKWFFRSAGIEYFTGEDLSAILEKVNYLNKFCK